MTVGVVVPMHNAEAYITDAIDSVLAQTYDDIDIVVVDDGSTDGSSAVVREFDDPRLSIVRHDTPRGLSASRNRGIQEVEGDLLAFLDHDDVWHPEKLQYHFHCHRDADADLVYSDVRSIDAAGRVIGRSYQPDPKPPGEPLVRQLLLGDRIVILTPSSVTIRRSALAAVGGYDLDLGISEDADLHLRLAGDHAFAHIDVPLVDKRDHDDNLSDDYRAMYRAHERLLEKTLDRYPFLDASDADRRRARTAYLRATSALLAGRSAEAAVYGREALRYELRLRPFLLVTLATTDRLAGPFDPGHRVFAWYDRHFG